MRKAPVMSIARAAAAVCFLALVQPPPAAASGISIYSYEPLSPEAKVLTRTGLSFEFEKGLLGGVRVERVVQTGDRGSAGLRPASEAALGPGGLRTALGVAHPAGPLYEILPPGDGKAFINAVCPGAERAWLLIGRLERFKDLELQAVGRAPGAGSVHVCSTMTFSFHSDWRLPDSDLPPAHLTGGRS